MSERADSSATVILSPSRNSTSTTASLEIPKGLKALLDDITKEVLNLSPESHQLYKVCADYLERRLIERDPPSLISTPVRRPPLRMISTYTTDSDSGLDVGATPIKGKFGEKGSSKLRAHISDWSQSSNCKGGTIPPVDNIQERGLLLSTSDFEEDTKGTSFPKKSHSESILEIEATFQETLLSRTELLLNDSGKLSPLYPPNNDKEGFTPAEELKEIRLDTLRRAKLPISVHFTNEKVLLNDYKSLDPCPPLRLYINPEKSQTTLRTKDECAQTTNSPPPVQDDVVARVLLEHAEEELDERIRDSRRTVNYLDLSKLGEEGETPASDEIWLPLGDEDKFLSSDTDTFSIATDKLSHIANMSGDEPPTHFPMETEDYSKFMGPIQEGLALTSQNVLDLSGKFKDLESTLRDLCQTVEEIKSTKSKQMDEIMDKMNEKCVRCSSNGIEVKEGTSSPGIKSKTIIDTTQIAEQLREDNSLLRQDLQRYRDREHKLLERLEGLEHRLLRVNINDPIPASPPSDRSTLPLIQTEHKKTKESTNSVMTESSSTEETIIPIDVNKSRRLSNDSRSSSAGNSRITAKFRPINDITLARSDNTILRQDIQICRERESQLLMRTIDLEDKIIKAVSEDETSKKKKKLKPEVNINIDFGVEQIKNSKNKQEALQTVKVEIKDDKLPGKEPLALGNTEKYSEIESKDKLLVGTEYEDKIEKSKEIDVLNVLENKPSKPKEKEPKVSTSNKNEDVINATPSIPLISKEEPKKSSKTQSYLKKEEASKLGKKDGKKMSTALPPPSTKESSSVAKSKELPKNSSSKSKLLESSNEVIEDQKPKKENVSSNSSPSKKLSSSSSLASKKPVVTQNKPSEKEKLVNQTESNKVVKQSLYDGDDWKVTISSKHQLETISQGPQTITISPKPPSSPPPPPPKTPPSKVIKKDTKVEVAKKEPKEKKVIVKREKPPPKTDPIPKPSMFPVARPPRGHIPIPPHRTVPKNPYQLLPVTSPPPTSDPFTPAYEINNNNINSTTNNPYDVLLKSRDTSSYESNSIIRSSPDGANSLTVLELKNGSNSSSSPRRSKSKVKEEGETCSSSSSSKGQKENAILNNEQLISSFDSNNNKNKALGHPPRLKRILKSPFKKLDSVSLNQRLRLSKRSKSTSQLNHPTPDVTRSKLIRTHHSIERLPTLSAFDEERVVWLKSFEDDITYAQERRKMQSLKELSPTDSSSPTSSSDGYTRSKSQDHVAFDRGGEGERRFSGHKEEALDSASSSDNEYKEIKKSLKRKSKKEKKSNKPLVAECFIISRGWQMDQSRLIRALDRIKCASFHRVQVATTMNRMVENLRPHQDVIVVQIGSQELLEASYGADDVSSVANSVSSIISKHIANVASQNRNTHFLVSLPIPRNTKDEDQITMRFHELRKTFNTSLSCNLLHFINVQCIDNENLSLQGSEGELEPKYYSDNVQLSSKGMRKLAKNWEEFLLRITKTKEGNIYVRRASDSSSGGSSNEPRKL